MRPHTLAILPLCCALLLAGSRAKSAESTPATKSPSERPLVLTTFLPVHSVAASVAGGSSRVENWLPAGMDPHDFQFSARDLRRLRDARVLLTGGLGLENWDEARLRRVSGNESLRLVEASHGLPAEVLIPSATGSHGHNHAHDHDHDHDHAHGPGPNPHFWLDPLLMRHAVTNVLATLVQLDAANRTGYEERARAFVDRLDRLHRELEAGLASCRETPFVTYHDAFPYLARRYGLKLAGVVEASAAEEPSARELAALYQGIRANRVKVLFTDGAPPRLARRIASDLNLRLASLETLETGTLGPDAYEAGMRRNLEMLRKHLAPAAP